MEGKTNSYDGDTLQVVASSGKNMEAIAVAMLVDRGLVRYEDPVEKQRFLLELQKALVE